MEYHFTLPVSDAQIMSLHVGDVVYLTGQVFTARDEAHRMMLEHKKSDLPFDPSSMAVYHCGPLMKKTDKGWQVVSAGPTTSGRMELFEDRFLEKFGTKMIIGKGGMGEKTQKALHQYHAVYTAYVGGAGALAADRVTKVPAVFWLEEFGMPEAVWIFDVKEFGPLVVAMDSFGESLYKK